MRADFAPSLFKCDTKLPPIFCATRASNSFSLPNPSNTNRTTPNLCGARIDIVCPFLPLNFPAEIAALTAPPVCLSNSLAVADNFPASPTKTTKASNFAFEFGKLVVCSKKEISVIILIFLCVVIVFTS